MSRVSLPLAALAGLLAAAPAALAQSSTVRIEPRPYYGATVTLEHGVRVYRPLPPTRYVIVNPDNRTPLNLSLTDVRETRTSHNYSYIEGAPTGGDVVRGGAYGVPFGFGGHAGPKKPFHKDGRVRGLDITRGLVKRSN